MSYPNWKDPNTAVKTVKAKVPVILSSDIVGGAVLLIPGPVLKVAE